MPTENKKQCEAASVYSAAFRGDAKAIPLLKAAGADVNMPYSADMMTPLHIAAERGYAEVIRALSFANADINRKDNRDKTPLHIAAERGHLAAVKELLDAGADASIPYFFFWTPLDCAKSAKHSAVVELLEAHCKTYPKGVKTLGNISATEGTPLLGQYRYYSGRRSDSDKENGTELSTVSQNTRGKNGLKQE